MSERRKYLKVVVARYAKGSRAERSALLTEMEAVTGLHRKVLIRLLRCPSLERTPKRPRVRRRHYGAAVADVVRVVWESLDYICAERLRPAPWNNPWHAQSPPLQLTERRRRSSGNIPK